MLSDLSCPYPGIQPFDEEWKEYFFGRDLQTDDIIERLAATRMVSVLGGSGSGKSSIIRAGVVPRLRSFGLPGAGTVWLIAALTPGREPEEALATALAGLLARGGDQSEQNDVMEIRARLEKRAWETPADFIELYRERLAISRQASEKRIFTDAEMVYRRESASLLLFVDQFEELLSDVNLRKEETRRIVNLLVNTFDKKPPSVAVVITMRNEDLHRCATFERLPDLLNGTFYLTRRLRRDELREVIERPAQEISGRYRKGVSLAKPAPAPFTDGLVAELLNAVGAIEHEPDHLPLLQHALRWLWIEATQGRGDGPVRTLGANDFDRLLAVEREDASGSGSLPNCGRLESAFDTTAQSLFDALSVRDQWIAQCIFRLLGSLDESGIAKRRIVRLAQIAEIARGELGAVRQEDVRRVIDHFRRPYPLLRVRGTGEDVDVWHEVLLRRWASLRQWLEEERQIEDALTSLVSRAQAQINRGLWWRLSGIIQKFSQQRAMVGAWAKPLSRISMRVNHLFQGTFSRSGLIRGLARRRPGLMGWGKRLPSLSVPLAQLVQRAFPAEGFLERGEIKRLAVWENRRRNRAWSSETYRRIAQSSSQRADGENRIVGERPQVSLGDVDLFWRGSRLRRTAILSAIWLLLLVTVTGLGLYWRTNLQNQQVEVQRAQEQLITRALRLQTLATEMVVAVQEPSRAYDDVRLLEGAAILALGPKLEEKREQLAADEDTGPGGAPPEYEATVRESLQVGQRAVMTMLDRRYTLGTDGRAGIDADGPSPTNCAESLNGEELIATTERPDKSFLAATLNKNEATPQLHFYHFREPHSCDPKLIFERGLPPGTKEVSISKGFESIAILAKNSDGEITAILADRIRWVISCDSVDDGCKGQSLRADWYPAPNRFVSDPHTAEKYLKHGVKFFSGHHFEPIPSDEVADFKEASDRGGPSGCSLQQASDCFIAEQDRGDGQHYTAEIELVPRPGLGADLRLTVSIGAPGQDGGMPILDLTLTGPAIAGVAFGTGANDGYLVFRIAAEESPSYVRIPWRTETLQRILCSAERKTIDKFKPEDAAKGNRSLLAVWNVLRDPAYQSGGSLCPSDQPQPDLRHANM